MTTYQEHEAWKKATTKTIAEAVAPLLGDDWHLDGSWPEDYNGNKLTGPSERCLHFNIGWRTNDRLEIDGHFDNGLSQYLPYREEREKTEITVAVNKAPEKIAQDIKKRLLPPYERMLAIAIERKRREDNYKAKRKEAMERVKNAIGGDVDFTTHRDEDALYGYKPYSFDAQYWTGGEIEFKIRLPLETAIEVLRFIRTL